MTTKAIPGCENTRKTYENLIADNVFDEGDAIALRSMILCDLVIDRDERDIYEELMKRPKDVEFTEQALAILSNDRGYSTIRESVDSHRHYHDLANKLIYGGIGVGVGAGIGVAVVFKLAASGVLNPIWGGILLTVVVLDILAIGVGVMLKYYSECNDIIPDASAAGLSN